jgi:hypothetical protein
MYTITLRIVRLTKMEVFHFAYLSAIAAITGRASLLTIRLLTDGIAGVARCADVDCRPALGRVLGDVRRDVEVAQVVDELVHRSARPIRGTVLGLGSKPNTARQDFGRSTARHLRASRRHRRLPRRTRSRGGSISTAKSSAWAGLAHSTRRQRENIFRGVIKTAGTVLLRDITSEVVRAGRERRAATPHAANHFLKALRGFFHWAVENDLIAVDPTRGVKMLVGKNDADGFHTWTQEELDRYEARWQLGTRERLAFDLLLYTGLRRGDAVRVGLQHVRDGVIVLRNEKHRGAAHRAGVLARR